MKMTLRTSTLRPGLLVSFKTSVRGNVTYDKKVLEANHVDEATGEALERWETERTVADPKEHEEAKKVRSKITGLLRGVCAYSAFGLLCPENRADDLEKAIKAARELEKDFNEKASLTRVHFYALTGRVAADDVEAVKAINSEVRELMETMTAGVKNLDVKVIRDAANRAKNLGSMLQPEAETRIRMAIEAAREAAKKIVKAGDEAAVEVDLQAVRVIEESRTMFLDLSEAEEVEAPTAEARTVDLGAAATAEMGV